jgi:hypothetical protein
MCDSSVQSPEASKKCSKCGAEKTLGEFSKHKKGKDGRRSTCRGCDKKDKRSWHDKNTRRSIIFSPKTKMFRSCGTEQPAVNFAVSKGCKDGLSGACKRCGGAASKRTYAFNRQRKEIDIPPIKKCPRCKKDKPKECFDIQDMSKAVEYLKVGASLLGDSWSV